MTADEKLESGCSRDDGIADVMIVGAGVAGVAAAASLAMQGFDVVLIAAHDRHPPEFRAEKAGEAQMRLFDRLGLGGAARSAMTAFDGVWLHRFGRIVERTTAREYGGDYGGLVNALRRALPPKVRQIVGRTETVETGPDVQTVTLLGGAQARARLLIVATGLSDALRGKLGVTREVYSPAHSLAAGFNLKRPPSSFPFPSLVWSGDRFGDRVSYLTLFPIGQKVRANFYVYRTQSEDWTRAFREQPEAGLRSVMPRLEPMFGHIAIDGPVVTRPIDLMRTHGYERDGMVLVGDAFCTVCPITGTGIDKALTDVDRLCNVHIPRWLATPGMDYAKIAGFYADPIKLARDASAVKESLDARAIKVENSLRWKLRRLRSALFGRLRYLRAENAAPKPAGACQG